MWNINTWTSEQKRALGVITRYTMSHILYKRCVDIFQQHQISSWQRSTKAIMVTIECEPFTIVWVNSVFTDMYGYSLEECVGRTPKLLQGPTTNRNVALNKKMCVYNVLMHYQSSVLFKRVVNHTANGTPIHVTCKIMVQDITFLHNKYCVQKTPVNERLLVVLTTFDEMPV